ncbi:MAG TPA: ATP synthase F0 subunit C [Isosphaeraceae bacterium]
MKLVKTLMLAFAVMLVAQATVSAQTPPPAGTAPVAAPFSNLREIAVGLVIIGAAMGIGNLAKGAVESMARQPEIAANIQLAMIIAAALIEGATFFALIVIGFGG